MAVSKHIEHVGPDKRVESFGLPWETEFGYAQAVKVGDTIWVSGQVGHDVSGKLLEPAPVNAQGRAIDFSGMAAQMRQAYENAARILARYGATLSNVVEEVIYTVDMPAAFAVGGPIRKKAYGSSQPQVACTLIVTPQLALLGQLVEIKMVARV